MFPLIHNSQCEPNIILCEVFEVAENGCTLNSQESANLRSFQDQQQSHGGFQGWKPHFTLRSLLCIHTTGTERVVFS